LVQYPYWVSSHSFAQRIIADRDSFIAASANDAYPRGISLHILNPKLHSNRGLDAIFRRHTRHAQADAFNDSLIGIKAKVLLPISGAIGDNNIRGTQLGGLLAAQDKVLLTFCTGDTTRSAKELQDVGVIIATRNGNVQKQTWLTQTPDTAEMNVRTSWIGNGNVLVVWDVFVRPEKPELFATTFPPPNTGKETKGDWKFLYSECMIVDQYGDIVSKAQKFDMQYSRENISTTYRRTRSYNSVTMVNGDVFIVRMTNDSTRFDITQFINTRRPLLPINAMMVSQTERERTSFVQEIKKPIVFTVTTCERCRDFKSLLEQRGIEYIELIIDKDIKNNEKMWQYLGKTGINSSVALPVVVIGKEVISCNSNEEFPIILGKIVK
jgi:glutaredoxin